MDKVTFANRALLRIGSKTIGSLSENSEAATLVNTFYEESIRDMLSEYKWRSAIKTADLVLAQQEDNMPSEYRFFIPTDNCRIIAVLDDNLTELDYIIEGRYVYTTNENAVLKYVAYDEFLIGYTAELIEALYMNLAIRMITRLGKSTQLLSIANAEASRAKLKAMKIDRNQRRKIKTPATSWGAKRSQRLYNG